MKNNMLSGALSALWQMMPALSNLVISLAVVRWFNDEAWGEVVSLLVVQQIATAALAWGNKDYLQREKAFNSGVFTQTFTNLMFQRALLLPFVAVALAAIGNSWSLWFALFALGGRFIQQSFDVVAIIERRFKPLLAMESITLLFQLAIIHHMCADYEFNSHHALIVIFGGQWIKGLITSALFYSYLTFHLQPIFHLKKAFYFSMLQLSGLLQNRVDLLVATQLLSSALLGRYQIVMAFLWNIQAGATYVSAPFVHHYYRLDEQQKRQWAKKLIQYGVLLSAAGVAIMQLALTYAFGFEFNVHLILPSLLFAMFSYVNLPWVYQLFQTRKQRTVLFIILLGTALLALMMLLFAAWISADLINLIWLMVAHQAVMTGMFYVGKRIHER